MTSSPPDFPSQSTPEGKGGGPWKMLAVGGCLTLLLGMCCCGALTGWIGWAEEGHVWGQPGDEIQSKVIQPGEPFTDTFTWDGLNYAFHEVWVEVQGVDQQGFELQGEFACERGSRPKGKPLDKGGHVFIEARRQQGEGGQFTVWYRLWEDYSRASATPYECWGSLDADPGKINKARLVITRHQRPSDMVAF